MNRETAGKLRNGHAGRHPRLFPPQPDICITRESHFKFRSAGQTAHAVNLLCGLSGMQVGSGSIPSSVSVCYELREYTLEDREAALVAQRLHLTRRVSGALCGQ